MIQFDCRCSEPAGVIRFGKSSASLVLETRLSSIEYSVSFWTTNRRRAAPAFGQEFLDIAVAQSVAEIEPNRVLDDLGREAMPAVAERSHPDILSDPPLASVPISVTMPAAGKAV